MHHMLTSLSEDDQCIIHFDMTSDDFLALFTEQNINRAEVLGIRLYSGDHRSTLSSVSRVYNIMTLFTREYMGNVL